MAELNPPQALLAPWTPANGWAPAGRAWLAGPHPVLSTPISTDTPGLELTIDEAAVFTVRMTDGTEIPETGAATATAEFSNGRLPVNWQPDPQPFAVAIDLTK